MPLPPRTDHEGGGPAPLGARTFQSAAWASGANLTVLALVLVRSILLARLLDVDVFGVYAFAGAVVALAAVCARFGLDDAFLHRARETTDEGTAAAAHFSLNLILGVTATLALAAGALMFAEGPLRFALLVLAVSQFGLQLTLTPRAILRRRVTHRSLAALNVSGTAAATTAGLVVAVLGGGLWALLAINVTTTVWTVAFLYGWAPVWRPRLAWDRRSLRYFLRFGGRSVVGHLLQESIARVDKLWVGALMPADALGLYARASAYALAPIAVLSRPSSMVFAGTFSELAGQRRRLSEAIAMVASILFRGGCLLVGLVGLLAPELIDVLIGAKWLPMVDPFRVLLAGFIFNPVIVTLSQLGIALGRPGVLAKIRAVHLLVLVAGMAALVPLWGLVGAAVAVGAGCYTALVLLLLAFRHDVELAASRLLGAPVIALAAGLAAGAYAPVLVGAGASPWAGAAIRAGAFVATYVLGLLVLEGPRVRAMATLLLRHLREARGSDGDRRSAAD